MRSVSSLVVLVGALAASLATARPAHAGDLRDDVGTDEEEMERDVFPPKVRGPWHFFAMPLLSWRNDDGFGFGGVVAASYAPEGRPPGAPPHDDQLRLRVFISTELVQRHELRYEKLDAFGLPLRLRASIGWTSTRSATFCGVGGTAVCDPAEAASAATRAGLQDDTQARVDFIRRYHRMRYMEPFAEVETRWRLIPAPWSLQAYTTTRATYHMPGDVLHPFPYPGSLYGQLHKDGEKGLYLVPQIGALFDARDGEAQPDAGFVVESAVRGSSSVWGSAASFVGVFGSAALYLPLPGPVPVVFATRLTGDVLFGDPPVTELGRTGGLNARAAYGGPWLGRGVRESRFIGDVKVVPQGEARVQLLKGLVFRWLVEVGGAAFVDMGWVLDTRRDDARALRPLWGTGTGLRILIDRRLVLRFDVATSPFEDAPASLYANIGNAV